MNIIPCAICSTPQTVNLEMLYSILSEATATPIESIRATNYQFVCYDCTKTAKYMTDYFSSHGKPHAVLPKKATAIFH